MLTFKSRGQNQTPGQQGVGVYLLWRLLLAVVVLAATAFIPYRSFLLYSGIENENIASSAPKLASQLIYPWANFDGIHYLQIAGRGYGDQARFLPLYPLLLAAIMLPLQVVTLSVQQVGLALLVQILLTGGLIVLLYKLWRLDHSAAVAQDAVWYVIFAPTAFFFSAVYTETFFLLLCVTALLLVRRRHLGWAVVLATAAGVTRLNGLVLVVPLALELWQAAGSSWQQKLRALSPLLVIPTGLFMYAYFNLRRWHDWLAFLHGHAQLANGRAAGSIVFPLQTAYRYIRILFTLPISQYEWWLALLEVAVTVGTGWLLYLGYKHKIRPSIWWFSALIWLIPVLSGTWSGMPRYALLMLGIYPTLATLYPVKSHRWVLWLSALTQALLLVCFSRGYLIG